MTPSLLIWMHFRAGYLDSGVPLLAKRWLRACYIVTIIFWPIRSLRSCVILVRLFGSCVISSRSIVVLCHIACLNFKGDELHLGLVSSGVHRNPSVDELWLCLVLYIFLGQGCASYFIYIGFGLLFLIRSHIGFLILRDGVVKYQSFVGLVWAFVV